MQSCAEDNIIVANYTTPGNYFHALRRQVKRSVKKPLIVMTPKSLLRHPGAVSPVSELADGAYRPFIPDAGGGTDRLVLCSGKVYYDALKARADAGLDGSVSIARVEQLYPFPEAEVRQALSGFAGKPVVWMQEEPQNMGYWSFVKPHLDALVAEANGGDCNHKVQFAGRSAAASPATGSAAVHAAEQKKLVAEALGTA